MYQKRSGFTLIEILIYISLLAAIALATSSWVVNLWISFMRQSKQSSMLMAVYCAHDVLIRDMRSAPRDAVLWKKRESTSVIWKSKSGHDIGYVCDDSKLLRIAGNFDSRSDTWHGATKSTLVRPVDTVCFQVNHINNKIMSVDFSITSQGMSVSQSVSLMQRELV